MAGIDPQLLAILACPLCKGPVVRAESKRELRCQECDRAYLINDEGVPTMTVDNK